MNISWSVCKLQQKNLYILYIRIRHGFVQNPRQTDEYLLCSIAWLRCARRFISRCFRVFFEISVYYRANTKASCKSNGSFFAAFVINCNIRIGFRFKCVVHFNVYLTSLCQRLPLWTLITLLPFDDIDLMLWIRRFKPHSFLAPSLFLLSSLSVTKAKSLSTEIERIQYWN